jgi:hypothetical protein
MPSQPKAEADIVGPLLFQTQQGHHDKTQATKAANIIALHNHLLKAVAQYIHQCWDGA